MKQLKLTLDQAKQLLKELGATVDVVDSEDAADKDLNFEDVAKELIPEPQTTGLSEDDVKRKVSAETGKLFGTFRSAFANAFGVKTSELDGLEAKEMAEKIKTGVSSRFTQTEAELRQQLEEVTNQLNSKEEEYTNKYATLESEWQGKFQERDIEDALVKTFNNIPRKGGDVSKQARLAFSEWRSRYDIKPNPINRELDFYEKGTDTLAMDGKNPVKAEALAKQFVTDLGLDVTNTSHIPPVDVQNNGGNGDGYRSGVQTQRSGVPANDRPVSDNFKKLVAEIAEDAE